MERFDAHIGSANAPLEKAPEILKAVSVDSPVDVLNSMVDDLMQIVFAQTFVAAHLIGVERRASFNVLADDGLQGMFLPMQESARCERFRRAPRHP